MPSPARTMTDPARSPMIERTPSEMDTTWPAVPSTPPMHV